MTHERTFAIVESLSRLKIKFDLTPLYCKLTWSSFLVITSLLIRFSPLVTTEDCFEPLEELTTDVVDETIDDVLGLAPVSDDGLVS